MARKRLLLGLPGLPVLSCVCFSTSHTPAPPFLVCYGHSLPPSPDLYIGTLASFQIELLALLFCTFKYQIFFPLVCLTLSCFGDLCYVSFCEIPLWPQLTQQGRQR